MNLGTYLTGFTPKRSTAFPRHSASNGVATRPTIRSSPVPWETQVVRGLWHHEGQVFEDDSMRVVVDVADLPENREFFRQFKERLKRLLKQIDILITAQTIRTI